MYDSPKDVSQIREHASCVNVTVNHHRHTFTCVKPYQTKCIMLFDQPEVLNTCISQVKQISADVVPTAKPEIDKRPDDDNGSD